MNILSIIRYFRNYITVRIENGFTERFLNLCSSEKIEIWDIEYKDNGITLKMFCKDFLKLRSIRKRSGVDIRLIEKNGFSFFLKRHRDRKVLITLIPLCLILMVFLNMFVWNIDVIGSDKFCKEQILDVVTEAGLKIGTFSPTFNEKDISRKIVNHFNGEILWLAINIKGSKATVEVRDYIKKEEEENDASPGNYVADFEGIIIDGKAFSGEQLIFPGNTVKKGNLLISGVTEKEDGSINYICSDGEFTALHSRSIKHNYPAVKQTGALSLKKEYISIDFFNISVPFSFMYLKKDTVKLKYNKHLMFDGNDIPLGFTKNIVFSEFVHDEKASLLQCVDSFTQSEYNQLKNSRITDAIYSIQHSENSYTIECVYNCIDYIGKKISFLKEN